MALVRSDPFRDVDRLFQQLWASQGAGTNGGRQMAMPMDAYRKDDIIKKFITNTAAPEIDVDVKKVALEQMQTPPFRARVDFYMVYYSPSDHSEIKRDLYTANFVFVFKSNVPNELIPINPLGLAITYFREDQAFK